MVLDMKKRLSTLLPSSARAQLQNVLTVEWDTHKTVLVEVPGGDLSRSNEMEMSGIENRSNAQYGKLDDEDDHEERAGLFNQSSLGRSRSGWGESSASANSRDYDQDHVDNGQRQRGSLRKKAPSLPYRSSYGDSDRDGHGIPEEDNPFDENSPTYKSSISSRPHLPSREERSPTQTSQRRTLPPPLGGHSGSASGNDMRKQTKTWQTFEESSYEVDGKGKKLDPWAQSGGWSQSTSPTSSRGTRHSAQLEAEDPFQ